LIHRTLQILDENRGLLEQFSKIAQKKYEVGKVTQQDVLKAQVELAKIKNRILVQKQTKEAARAKINSLLGQLPQALLGDPFPLDDVPLDLDFGKLISRTIEHRPELKHHESIVKSSQYNVRLAKRQYWPDFFARFESRQFQGTGLEEYDVMLGVTIPWLWTRSRAHSGIKEAQASLQAAEKAYEAKRNEIFFEIKNALVKVETARSLVLLYQSDVLPTARQVVQISQINYQTDKVDFLTLLDSQRNLLEFQLEYETALADYHKNLAELERNIGVDLITEKQETEMERSKD
jgi:outer membrane protein TolC